MEVYIAIPKTCTSEWKDSVKKRYKKVLEFTKIQELSAENKKYIVLQQNEHIKAMESLEKCNFSCVSDGDWLIKEKRIYNFKSFEKSPILIVRDDVFDYPLILQPQLKDLYISKNYQDFAMEAEKHIFSHGSYVMLDYYLSIVYFFVLKKHKEAQDKITNLLYKKPTFAEGWCVLGDMFLTQKRNGLAKQAYENAIIKGKDRDIYDDDPVWLKKYDEYPKEKLSKIENLISNIQIVSKNKF